MGCSQSEIQGPLMTNSIRGLEDPFKKVKYDVPKPQVGMKQHTLDDGDRQVLFAIIQRDSQKELAFCLDEWKIPVASEIQNPGSFWTLMHFCARWNAAKCLSFVLRKYYQDHPADYVKFVNTQTSEGYTPLMLSVIWDAQKCFDVLASFGGSDLSLRDSRGSDVFQHSFVYRRENVQKALAPYRQSNMNLMNVNTKLLQASVNLDAMLISTEDASDHIQKEAAIKLNPQLEKQLQQFRLQQDEILKANQRELAKLAEEFKKEQERYFAERKKIVEEQLKLKEAALKQQGEEIEKSRNQWLAKQNEHMQQWEQKQKGTKKAGKNVKEQAQNFGNMFEEEMPQNFVRLDKKREEQEAMKLKAEEQRALEERKRASQKQAERAQREFLEKQLEIQKKREEELKKVIEQMKRAEELRIQKQQQGFEKEKKEKNKQLELKLKEQENQRKIAQEREQMKKALEEQKRQAEQQTDEPVQEQVEEGGEQQQQQDLQCPADVLPLYEKVLAKKVNFIDDKFPPKVTTIGPLNKMEQDAKTSVWLRPAQIFNGEYQLFDEIDPEDILQGTLGVCYYLSTLASMAQNEDRIRSLFPFYNKDLGFYVVRLCIDGKPTHIVVDDYMPCFRGRNEPLFTRPNGNEIWVMILEKAWVKCFGSYLTAEGMSPALMFEEISGVPSYFYVLDEDEPDTIFQNLKSYDEANYFIVLSSRPEGEVPVGIAEQHAYSLLQVFDIEGVQLYKIRNPWGNFEWEGNYANDSENWTPELQQAVGYVEGDDGIFFMTPDEFQLAFRFASIGMIMEDYNYQFLEVTCQPREELYYTFSVKEEADISIRVMQKFDRYIKDKGYKYSPFVFEVGRIDSPENATLMGEGDARSLEGEKSVHFHDDVYVTFAPGDYFIRIKMLWIQNNRSILIATYSPEPITLKKISNVEGTKHWKNMVKNHIMEESRQNIGSNLELVQFWLKGQYIFYIENNSTENTTLLVTFDNTLSNLRTEVGKVSPNQLSLKLPSGGWDLGSMERISLTGDCHVGNFNYNKGR